jgi:hypothetical protein
MAVKDSFTPDEWSRIVGAPMLAGIAVTAADPGGLWGAVKEGTATASALREGAGGADGLVKEVASAYQESEGRDMARDALKGQTSGKKPAEIVDAAVAELGAIAGLVASKTPAEAPAFKAWLREIAAKVAEAGTEGGFLGFGGVKVSDAERATLDRVGAALA